MFTQASNQINSGSAPDGRNLNQDGAPPASSSPKPAVSARVEGYRFKPQNLSTIGSSSAFQPSEGFRFQSDTRDLIQSGAVQPNSSATAIDGFKPESIVSPNVSNVDVMADGKTMNSAPSDIDNAVRSMSYLEALSRGQIKVSESSYSNELVGAAAPRGGSYLESLSKVSNSGSNTMRP